MRDIRTLQHTATRCNTLQQGGLEDFVDKEIHTYTAICRSAACSECVVVCCKCVASVL